MPGKAVEQKGAMRMPKQYVRPGRGVAGYTGNVVEYEVPRERGSKPVVANAAGDIKAAAPKEEKLDAASLTRKQLESIAEQRGLTAEQVDAAVTKAELVDLIEAAGP